MRRTGFATGGWLGGASILCLALLLGLAVAPAAAEEDRPSYEPRKAHAESDRNGDGQVDRAEFHERMVEVFFFGDRDRDGFMTWAELEASVAFPDDFKGADKDGDGRISLYEFIQVRFYDYDLVDTNDDGLLSVEEVTVVFEGGGVR